MKRMFVRILVVLLIGVAALLYAEKAKITIWAWDPNFNIPIMQEAAARYKKINPNVEFEIVNMAKADVEQKLNTILASGVKTGLPEIVLIEDYNAQKYLQSYPGAFADLTKHFTWSEFAPYKVKLMTLNNKVYGVPFDSGVAGFFYRIDYIEQLGSNHLTSKTSHGIGSLKLEKLLKKRQENI